MSTDKLEELIKLAQDAIDEDKETPKAADRRSRYTRAVKRFIIEKGIKDGEVRVPVYKMVHEYYKWEGVSGRKASPRELGRILAKYFKRHKTGTYRYYMLNAFCDMSKEELKASKEYYKQYFLKRKQRNGKKKNEKTTKVQQSEHQTNLE